jgi:uncharacterized membrane protein
MKTALVAYFSALVVMLIMDGAWLSLMVKRYYAPRIGHLMGTVRVGPAIVFYLLYALGMTILIVLPAVREQRESIRIFLNGALLGLMAYATYDLTNQATLKDWPTSMTVVDVAWGTLLTGTVCVVSSYIAKFVR